jgi:hypothetical protein
MLVAPTAGAETPSPDASAPPQIEIEHQGGIIFRMKDECPIFFSEEKKIEKFHGDNRLLQSIQKSKFNRKGCRNDHSQNHHDRSSGKAERGVANPSFND